MIVFAHRGGATGRRENTLPAFRNALGIGAGGLESDVWLTADGSAVLDHDGVCGPLWRRRPISALPRQQLPVRVPTVSELYRACGADFDLSLDVCDPAALPGVVAASRTAGALGRLWLCHGDRHRLASWRPDVGPARLVHSTASVRSPEGAARLAAALAASEIDAVNLFWREWRPDLVEAVHVGGILALAWGVPGRRRARHLVGMGIDGIYGNRVKALLAGAAGGQGTASAGDGHHAGTAGLRHRHDRRPRGPCAE